MFLTVPTCFLPHHHFFYRILFYIKLVRLLPFGYVCYRSVMLLAVLFRLLPSRCVFENPVTFPSYRPVVSLAFSSRLLACRCISFLPSRHVSYHTVSPPTPRFVFFLPSRFDSLLSSDFVSFLPPRYVSTAPHTSYRSVTSPAVLPCLLPSRHTSYSPVLFHSFPSRPVVFPTVSYCFLPLLLYRLCFLIDRYFSHPAIIFFRNLLFMVG